MPSAKSKLKPKPSQPTVSWQFEAIGTSWWLGVYEPIEPNIFEPLKKAITDRIIIYDQTYSRFRADSVVGQISRRAGVFDFPEDSQLLFTFYRQLYEATNGSVTPLIGDVLVAAGYDAQYSLQPKMLHRPPAWDDVLQVEANRINTKRPVTLDFGAAGKGYLVDIISELLQVAGLQHYCLDASGDLYNFGDQMVTVGLENPNDSTQVIGIAELHNQALCGSAGNRRAWEGYHHIIDPISLQSVQAIKAVWVVAANTMLADGLATALFFVAPSQLQQFSFEYLVVNADNKLMVSAHFPATIFGSDDL